ncbi:MAG TPA: NusG domain II-containing protein [Candidatus Blautia pullicola]|uniref:NusG domain II-containing protein n=1 Tax=Candidatus Blautia pullicola TaxID=2838498 RepID=A0A9D2FTE4_9FIRM|nr:NusG domain II-containing protein [Candidatus Blautia pullicola]
MKKRDFILIGVVLVLALLLWLLPRALGFFSVQGEKQVRITVEGELYGIYDLQEEQTIEINDSNLCRIQDGEVNMTEADCPDKLCMHQGPISISGETIVCLPNKVVIEIVGKDEKDSGSQIDGMAR